MQRLLNTIGVNGIWFVLLAAFKFFPEIVLLLFEIIHKTSLQIVFSGATLQEIVPVKTVGGWAQQISQHFFLKL